jgi:uncharacterized protein (TIGR02594 family)
MKWNFPLPPWIDLAMRFRGLREIPGKQHAPKIQMMLKKLGAWWTDDETPWCGVFVGYCLKESGIVPPKHWYRAKGYSDYGTAVSKSSIPMGAICVKSRKGGGHVFYAVAQTADGKTIFGLGGNQSNMVNIVPFSIEEIDDVRWPPVSINRVSLPIATREEIGAVSKGSEA